MSCNIGSLGENEHALAKRKSLLIEFVVINNTYHINEYIRCEWRNIEMSTKNINFEPMYRESDDFKYPRVITIISAKKCARIRIDEVEYIEQDGRVLHIYTANRDYAAYESINKIADMLNPRYFFRPLKGLIINFDHVREVSGASVFFESGQSVGLGRNKLCLTRAAFRRFLNDFPPYIPMGEGLRVAE